MKPIASYKATIFHNARTLYIVMDYFKTTIKVFIFKDENNKLLDTIKVKRYGTAPWVVAREYAIKKGYF